MPETLTDKELLEVTKKLLETYESELERESAERAKQATVDSQQAEILAQEKVEAEKQAELDAKAQAEKEAKEKQELIEFRENLIKSVGDVEPIDYTSKFVDLDSRLQTIEKNTKVDESVGNSGFYADVTIIFFLWFIFPAIFAYKSLNWFFSWM